MLGCTQTFARGTSTRPKRPITKLPASSNCCQPRKVQVQLTYLPTYLHPPHTLPLPLQLLLFASKTLLHLYLHLSRYLFSLALSPIRMPPIPSLPEGKPGRSRATRRTAKRLWPPTYTAIPHSGRPLWCVQRLLTRNEGPHEAGPGASRDHIGRGSQQGPRGGRGNTTIDAVTALLRQQQQWAAVRATVLIRKVCSPYGLAKPKRAANDRN